MYILTQSHRLNETRMHLDNDTCQQTQMLNEPKVVIDIDTFQTDMVMQARRVDEPITDTDSDTF